MAPRVPAEILGQAPHPVLTFLVVIVNIINHREDVLDRPKLKHTLKPLTHFLIILSCESNNKFLTFHHTFLEKL